MNPRIVQTWHSYALGLIRVAKVARDITGCRTTMRQFALEAISYQRKVDPTVFRHQRSLPL